MCFIFQVHVPVFDTNGSSEKVEYLHFHCHSALLRVASNWFRGALQSDQVKAIVMPRSFVYHKLCEEKVCGTLIVDRKHIVHFFNMCKYCILHITSRL